MAHKKPKVQTGETNEHTHTYVKGDKKTSKDKGHSHEVKLNSAITEVADDHTHHIPVSFDSKEAQALSKMNPNDSLGDKLANILYLLRQKRLGDVCTPDTYRNRTIDSLVDSIYEELNDV